MLFVNKFINGFDFIRMKPMNSVIKGGVPQKATARVLAEEGKAYAVYVNGGGEAKLSMGLPKGRYKAEWVDTKSGRIDKSERFEHKGGKRVIASPKYVDDIALRVINTDAKGR